MTCPTCHRPQPARGETPPQLAGCCTGTDGEACLKEQVRALRERLAQHEAVDAREGPHRALLNEQTIGMHSDPPFILERATILIDRLEVERNKAEVRLAAIGAAAGKVTKARRRLRAACFGGAALDAEFAAVEELIRLALPRKGGGL